MDTPGKIKIAESDELLLEECTVQRFKSGGKGGQHVNKTESGVRLIHRETGITVECRKERSQHLNKSICLKRLRKKLENLCKEEKKRIPTKKPRSAARKRLETKTAVADKKKMRRKPPLD